MGLKNISEIIVLFKTHLDVGYTDFAENVVKNYMEVFIPGALNVAKQMRGEKERFIWTTGSWLISRFLDESPQREEMEDAIRNGDIRWHGLPFTIHTELMDRELFQYGLSLSQKLDERFGMKTIAAKMTDVPGHTRAMVSELANAGLKFLHLGVNPASSVPDVPPLFRWKAPDGQEIVVMYKTEITENLRKSEIPASPCISHIPEITAGLSLRKKSDGCIKTFIRNIPERFCVPERWRTWHRLPFPYRIFR